MLLSTTTTLTSIHVEGIIREREKTTQVVKMMDNKKKFNLIVVLDEQKDNDNWTHLHQSLLMLFDSPLNHEGYLEVLIRLKDGRFIKMHREVRVPRTFKRFEQLFNNFLEGCDMPMVQTKDGQCRLLQFINQHKILYNKSDATAQFRICNLAAKLKSCDYFADQLDKKLIIYIGFGPVDFNVLGDEREEEYETKTISYGSEEEEKNTYSISRYPLSSALTCVKLLTSFEKALDVF